MKNRKYVYSLHWYLEDECYLDSVHWDISSIEMIVKEDIINKDDKLYIDYDDGFVYVNDVCKGYIDKVEIY